jgi:hypothetical protein
VLALVVFLIRHRRNQSNDADDVHQRDLQVLPLDDVLVNPQNDNIAAPNENNKHRQYDNVPDVQQPPTPQPDEELKETPEQKQERKKTYDNIPHFHQAPEKNNV